MKSIYIVLFSTFVCMSACATEPGAEETHTAQVKDVQPTESVMSLDEIPPGMELQKATFGAGCFWCVEAVFQDLQGVYKVESGYAGGDKINPTYKEVCSGTTGHAEVAQISYNPQEISFEELLEVFWQTHDPTTLNRQGADVGTQYRSAVFYHNAEQKEKAEFYKNQLNNSGAFDDPIVTTIEEYRDDNYFPAEDYHQNYFNENPNNSYCQFVIAPKVDKFRKAFQAKLKGSTVK